MAPARPGPKGAAHQCRKGQHAALAVVVGPQHDGDVLDRHDDGERPHHHRDNPEHVARGGPDAAAVDGKDRLDGVQRAGADVAVDDAQRP